ncbi:MAG: hypothetical protein H7Y02_12190 [Candidatus Obscuribacterales bacterium]|nr:hypothetical protein [Steroidobacteraceae bacterium]
MRISYSVLVASTILVSLAACGPDKKAEPKPPPPPAVKDTVFGDLVGTKDRARDETNKTMQQRNEQMDQAVKKNEAAD